MEIDQEATMIEITIEVNPLIMEVLAVVGFAQINPEASIVTDPPRLEVTQGMVVEIQFLTASKKINFSQKLLLKALIR